MTDRIKKEEFVRRLAARMNSDETTAAAWIDGVVETLYESFKAGESVTLPSLLFTVILHFLAIFF